MITGYWWPCGATDKASDYESGDSRYESWQGRNILSHTKSLSNVVIFRILIVR